eukprot:TRINITY_DN7608_c0_g3_i3.p2 TRINITY_DN7608_c0_g3~~TRINITY_DN7608_c0_g3_i3.p2  ORF type:complete len:331 (+),score=33.44 TRINITY_DN7608_c0_g3_i3:2-994(+)
MRKDKGGADSKKGEKKGREGMVVKKGGERGEGKKRQVQREGTSTQKSVEFLCNKTALEALIVGLEVLHQKAGEEQEEEETAKSDLATKQAHAMISGAWSQVQGLKNLSHARLYLQDTQALHRAAKMTSFDSMNQALLQIFNDRIPFAMKHVTHEFYYELIQDQLYYGVDLKFNLEDGTNNVRYRSLYGFTDALMQAYEVFCKRLGSWGVNLRNGCEQPLIPSFRQLNRSSVLEIAGIEKKKYSKDQLLRIASETTANAALVNEITSKLVPWELGREVTKVVEIPLAMAPVWSMPLPADETEKYNPNDLCALLKSKSSAIDHVSHVAMCAS